MKNKIFHWNNFDERLAIINSLRQDNINLSSTDTVLGLLGRLTQKSFDKLNKIKERNDKPYIILVESLEKAQLFSHSFQIENIMRLAQIVWPGPVTLIVKANQSLPKFLKSTNNTIALRIPKHEGLLAILRQFDGLFSTSANKAGMPVPNSLNEIEPTIIAAIDHIIVDIEKEIKNIPSTILDCTGAQIKVIRQGAYPVEELKKHNFVL